MFSWFISLLMLFGYHGNATTVPSVGPDGNGNRHVAPADNPQPNPPDSFVVDGGGGKG